ncbi:MAG TPA: hypothetical protein VGC79_10200 [Polyangiaceae bacterium]
MNRQQTVTCMQVIRAWLCLPMLLVVLHGCGSSSAEERLAQERQSRESNWIEVGKDAVRAKLKDPDSATFRNAVFRRHGAAPLACGEVNAKNSFGGKGGFQRFIFMGGQLGVVFEEGMKSTEFNNLWDTVCAH